MSLDSSSLLRGQPVMQKKKKKTPPETGCIRHVKLKREHEKANQHTQVAEFLSMQVKMTRGLVTKTKAEKGAFQIYQQRAIIGPQRTVPVTFESSGSYVRVRISFASDCTSP